MRAGSQAATPNTLGAQLPLDETNPGVTVVVLQGAIRIDQVSLAAMLWASRHAGPRLPFDAVVNRALRRIPYGPAAARVFTEPVNDHLDAGHLEGQCETAPVARTACGPD